LRSRRRREKQSRYFIEIAISRVAGFAMVATMYETIDEPIKVLVSFGQNQVRPLIFEWRGKKYEIDKVNLVHQQRAGNDKLYYFSVSDQANYFKLSFNTRDFNWRLEELYTEG